MSERVSRKFEASRSKVAVNQLLPSTLASRQLPAELRKEFDFVGARTSSAKQLSGHPRLYTSSQADRKLSSAKAMLKDITSNLKRAASSKVFQRMRERFAHLHSLSSLRNTVTSHGVPGMRSLRPSESRKRQSVASRSQ